MAENKIVGDVITARVSDTSDESSGPGGCLAALLVVCAGLATLDVFMVAAALRWLVT